VVEDEGKDYRTILSSLRSKIRNVSAGQTIRSVSSTRGGKLLVTTGKSDEDLKVLSRIIRGAFEIIKPRKVGLARRVKTLHIRGMDALTAIAEVGSLAHGEKSHTPQGILVSWGLYLNVFSPPHENKKKIRSDHFQFKCKELL
jgi:hypothetical protein